MVTVEVTYHALAYTRHGRRSRTSLSVKEIETLVATESYIHLGKDGDMHFCLSWDWHQEKGVIFLLAERQTLVSIWETHFTLPGAISSPDTDKLIAARDMVAMIALT